MSYGGPHPENIREVMRDHVISPTHNIFLHVEIGRCRQFVGLSRACVGLTFFPFPELTAFCTWTALLLTLVLFLETWRFNSKKVTLLHGAFQLVYRAIFVCLVNHEVQLWAAVRASTTFDSTLPSKSISPNTHTFWIFRMLSRFGSAGLNLRMRLRKSSE